MQPELPYAPCSMITLAMGGEGAGETAHFWFLRTLESQFDYYGAYTKMMNALLPRWGGSHGEMLIFARNCLETNRFETVVPYVVAEVLKELRDREKEDLLNHSAARQLLRDLAAKRNAYRAGSPDSRLYEDDGAYRADLVLLMEECQLPDLAAAELRIAGNTIDWTRLCHDRRPGRYLAARLIAAQGPTGKRVIEFDEKLRQPWHVNSDVGQLELLSHEYQDLKNRVRGGIVVGRPTAGNVSGHQ